MGVAAGAIGLANHVPLIFRVHRPHDGIVTEKSCNITDPQNAPLARSIMQMVIGSTTRVYMRGIIKRTIAIT